MSLTDRSRALVSKIDAVSKLPLLTRATSAEALVREAAGLLIELSMRSEEHAAALENLLHLVELRCAKPSDK